MCACCGVSVRRAAHGPPTAYSNGVTDGVRTRDHQDHNLVLYQLSYGYHVLAARVCHTVSAFVRSVSCRPPVRALVVIG
jgi:hypothetical protein